MNLSTLLTPMTRPPGSATTSIGAELVDMFHRRAPAPLIALNILFAVLLLTLWWGHLPVEALLLWFGAITLIASANILRHRRYEAELSANTVDVTNWQRLFVSGTLANGMAWGAGGILFYAPSMPLHSAVILLLICGIAAGVAASQATLWQAVLFFALSSTLPPALVIASIGEPIHWVVSGLLLFYCVYILTVGRINHQTMTDVIRLKFANTQLMRNLQESEQHFRSLIENTPDMVVAVAGDGRLLFHSPSTEIMLGYAGEQLASRSVFELIHPDDHAQIRDKMQHLLAVPGASTTAETRWQHGNGQWRLLQCVARRLGDSEPPALVVNARDITEQRAMEDELRQAKEAAEQANRVKSQFLATISHEIRTPMHAILGMAEMLQESPLNAEQQGYVHTFQNAGQHLLELINDILDFSRFEAGGLQLEQIPFNLAELVQEVGELLGPQAQARKIQLELQLSPLIAPWHIGDPQRLRQVIVNLLGNAIKFTDEGGVIFKVDPDDTVADRLRFEVSDSGIGIPQRQQAMLFTPFTQLREHDACSRGGTGLGLSISQHLVNAMGGVIRVHSIEGEGSRFSFAVTLPEADVAPDTRQHGPITIDPATLPPARLLVADDSVMNQRVIKDFLHGTPCSITFAENGVEAVSLYEREPYDMVLMDIQMPLLNGWDATRQIRRLERSNNQRTVPIVALTAAAMEEDRTASLAAGCTAFVAKPLGRNELLQLLHTYLPPAVA